MENTTKWADVAHYYQKSAIFIQTDDVGIREMLGAQGTRGVMYATRAHAMLSRWSQHKPILRHRDDMLLHEAKEFDTIVRPNALRLEVDEQYMVYVAHRVEKFKPNEFLWLISRGFDMFDLIESGQAIRK